MEIKNKLKNLAEKVLERPIKSAIILGLAGLVTVTALKDNVHFGSVNLYNSQENHYVWGIIPETKIIGRETKGNIYTFGLLFGLNSISDSTNHEGGLNAYGLIGGGNMLGYNSTITGDINSYGLIISNNNLKDNCTITGDINSFGAASWNIDGISVGKNSHLGLKNYKFRVKN